MELNIFNITEDRLVETIYNDSMKAKRGLYCYGEEGALTTSVKREYLIRSLLTDENVVARVAGRGVVLGESLKKAALGDLAALFSKPVEDEFTEYHPSTSGRKHWFNEYGESLKKLTYVNDIDDLLEGLYAHYSIFGGGPLSEYKGFRWIGKLKGIENVDSIKFSDLIGLEGEKEVLTSNVKKFLSNRPYNNMLLYGDSGSGKSSCVKALLNEYYMEGLRLIDLPVEEMYSLPKLFARVKDSHFHYIIFMDDLSFEEGDNGYKVLKMLMDGQTEKQPVNVMICATSNRRNLLNETWESREGSDIHRNDTIQEKKSLSERFGLKVFFGGSDMKEYLHILKGIFKNNGIEASQELLEEGRLFAMRYNGFTGRTARQFADYVLEDR